MKISVAHATRRPEKALEIRKLWMEAAADPSQVEWVFGIDEDDAKSRGLLASEPHTVSTAGGGGVRAFNDATKATSGEIIICACDDTYPFPGWDKAVIERIGDTSLPRSLLTGDGFRNDRLATLTIITRAMYNERGYVYPPQFKALGADTWQTERAYRDGQMIDASDLIFEHRHPFYKKAETDALYQSSNSEESKHEATRIIREVLEPLPITLCMIVGNEEAVIERCLDSAKSCFDELSLVRAVGTTPPDRTVELVRIWCAKHRVPLLFKEYKNLIPMPHVDNFAAARNLSFEQAKTYWCLWLDADDTLTEEMCLRIREAATNSRFEGQEFRYVTPEGGDFYRERLIKRGKGYWRGSVHEQCVILGDMCRVPEIQVNHSPPAGKNQSARNIAILDNVGHDMPRYWFYRQEELMRLGQSDEAYAAGTAALAVLPDSMPAERYEVCLNMSQLKPAETERWSFEAMKINPARREALADLTQFEINRGYPGRAVQYFKWMDSIPVPSPKPWTHRPIWYGWARNWLKVRLLRAIGKTDGADREHAEHMKDPVYAEEVSKL